MFTHIKTPAFLCLLIVSILNFGCGKKNKLKLSAQIKNNKSTYALLDEIHFDLLTAKKPDTVYLKDGKFTKDISVDEEGLHRLILPEDNITVFFINDQPEISLDIDAQDHDYKKLTSNTSLNKKLHELGNYIYNTQLELSPMEVQLDQAINTKNQAMVDELNQILNQRAIAYQTYMLQYADTVSSPVLAMFAFSNSNYGNAAQMLLFAQNLAKRFPNHKGVGEFLKALDKNAKSEPTPTPGPAVGTDAPDFTFNDVNGKPLSLSSFKGKYVLVDFWASWCGPCRAENENVLRAFNKFKDKNFTILGVSLDEKKEDWLAAIHEDQLTWTHVSDLKGWESKAVGLYKIDGIPYNVLLDPSGKILATSLRGDDLEQMLQKTLP